MREHVFRDRTFSTSSVAKSAPVQSPTRVASAALTISSGTKTQNEPENDFVSEDGIRHQTWVITDKETNHKIETILSEVDNFYVADGHHRSAAAAIVGRERREANPSHTGNEEYNFFLAVLFPDNQLHIMDYNRVLKNLNGHSSDELFQSLEEYFTIKKTGPKPFKPKKKGTFGMYCDKNWYKLIAKSEHMEKHDPVESLDISYLQKNLLEPFFGIKDPRTSDDIDFVGGIRGLEELVKLVDSGQFKVAFALYPTSVKELMDIADSGRVMPPKSTWFEPKLRSGLLVHMLED